MPSDPVILAQLLFVVVVLAMVGTVVLDKTIRHPGFVIGALYLSRGFLPALAALAGVLTGGAEASPLSVWMGRFSTLTLLLALGAALLLTDRSPLRRAGADLFVAALAFALAGAYSELATESLQQGTLLMTAGMLVIGLARLDPAWLAQLTKGVLLIYIVGSMVAMVLSAPLAWAPPGEALLPGVDARLQGITPHPNQLGPLMVLYLIMERIRPSRPAYRLAASLAAVGLLVLAQSKTAWAAALLVFLIHWAGEPARKRIARFLVAAATIGAAGLVVSVGELSPPDVDATQQIENARTLTGRTGLWEVGFEAWRESPVFGAGATFFVDYAQRTGQEWAGQAHNQYVHTLARHGLIGLAGLLVYTALLVRTAFRHSHATRYGSLSLVALLLLRGLTEANLHSLYFEHLAVLSLLLAWERAAAAKQESVREPGHVAMREGA